MYICNKNNLSKNLKFLKDYKKVMIEQFIPGREIQSAIIGKRNLEQSSLNQRENFMIIKQSIILMLRQNILFQ